MFTELQYNQFVLHKLCSTCTSKQCTIHNVQVNNAYLNNYKIYQPKVQNSVETLRGVMRSARGVED